jgi:hypothetical protein
MKCISCLHDSKAKERASGVCPNCQKRFAFDPSSGDPFTDAAFAGAIARVSSQDAVRFTESNLYYELSKTKRSAPMSMSWRILIGIFMMAGALIFAGFAQSVLLLLLLCLPVAALFAWPYVVKASPSPILLWETYQYMLRKWQAAHGLPAKLIVPAPPQLRSALPPELSTYSFDRAVICDRQETVDLLLANNFHFENNCAILSVDGYPQTLFDSVREMLRRNPKIEVFALHDASSRGHSLARTLASSPAWFQGIGRVTDVGLSEAHAQHLRGMWLPIQGAAKSGTWLSQYTVELASMRPEQIIKRLFRAMTQPGVELQSDGYIYYVTDTSFGRSDASTSDGGGDSFG